MTRPHRLELPDNCNACKFRADNFFCQFPTATLKEFNTLKHVSAYSKGVILFMDQQAAQGVYVLCTGQIKLWVGSSDGKTLILKLVKPGELLGLFPILTGAPNEATAEVVRPSQIAFVSREEFLAFLSRHPEAYQGVARQMMSHYRAASDQLRTLGLYASVTAKLAQFLLNWPGGEPGLRGAARARLPLTHHEIGEFIGATRETVTRTLTDFKNRRLVAMDGAVLTIPDRAALETYVDSVD